MTVRPARANHDEAAEPAGPPPITSTSESNARAEDDAEVDRDTERHYARMPRAARSARLIRLPARPWHTAASTDGAVSRVSRRELRAGRSSLGRWHAGALNNRLVFGATYQGVTRLPRWCSYRIGDAATWLAYHLMRRGTTS